MFLFLIFQKGKINYECILALYFTLDIIEMNAMHNSANAYNRFQDNIKPKHLCLKGKKVIEMLTSGKILIQLLGVTIVRKEEDVNTLTHLFYPWRRGMSVSGVDIPLMLTYHLHDSKLDVKSATVTDIPRSFVS